MKTLSSRNVNRCPLSCNLFNVKKFIDKVKKITQPTELTAELVHEFVGKIIVHAPRYLDGQRYQIIDIYYNGIGVIRGLSPEEMEEAFQKRLEQIKSKTA